MIKRNLTFLFFLLNFVAVSQVNITVQEIVSGLNYPTDIQSAGDSRLFVSENTGLIRIIEGNTIVGTPFLNISDRVYNTQWQGIHSFVFHPDYQNNGYLYVKYIKANTQSFVVSRFTRINSNQADPNSEQVLLSIPNWWSHQGGSLAFGADGYLYITTGDSGPQGRGEIGDTANLSQNLSSLKGKILRIDVNNGNPYVIPASNPYIDANDNIPDEIWARGVRNPWRMSFDRATSDLWLGDNGQDGWEEVDFVANNNIPTDLNFGWRCYEGSQRYPYQLVCNDSTTMVFPIQVFAGYNNNGQQSASVIGGYVYRGSQSPALYGHYIYGDYSSGRIWTLRRHADGSTTNTLQSPTLANIVSFGQDNLGELYAITFFEGKLYKISAPPCSPTQILTTSDPIKQSINIATQQYIQANNTISNGAVVELKASNYIELKAGFQAEAGTVLKTQIGGCN